MPELPEGLTGLRIVHLSDFHLGPPSRGQRAAERAVAWAASRAPDLVLITGDLVSHPRGEPLLRELLAQLQHCYVILGNHDVESSRDPFSRAAGLSDLSPARLLVDESRDDRATRRACADRRHRPAYVPARSASRAARRHERRPAHPSVPFPDSARPRCAGHVPASPLGAHARRADHACRTRSARCGSRTSNAAVLDGRLRTRRDDDARVGRSSGRRSCRSGSLRGPKRRNWCYNAIQ